MSNNQKEKIKKLLIWSQKWTKTDMTYLVKEGFWLNLSQILMIITNVTLTVIFANFLDIKVYGIYKFIISFISILSIASLSGMGTAIVRGVARGYDEVLIFALKEKMKWSILSGIGGFLIAIFYYINGNNELFLSFLLLAIFVPLIGSFDKIWESYLNGKKKFKKLSQYQVIANFINKIIVIIVVFLTKNLFYILFSYLFSLVVIRIIMFFIVIKKYPLNKKNDTKSIGYGKHLSLMNIISTISGKIDSILIFHFLGPIEVAVYTFAQIPIKYLNSPLSTLSQLALPKLSQRNIFDLKKTILPKMIKIFVLIVPMVIIYILIIPYFFHFLLPKYTQSIIYSQVLALSVLFSPMILINQTLIAHAQKKQLYILKIVIPTLKIILFLILLPLYGIWGGVATLVIVPIINFVFLMFFLKHN